MSEKQIPTPMTDAECRKRYIEQFYALSTDPIDPDRMAQVRPSQDFARQLERKLAYARSVLSLIEVYGGKFAPEGVDCNGSWCAEQARLALESHETHNQ